jgi:trehalose 6-phosphate phosphatase
MDGVITKTAVAHAAAWKRMFDEYLQARAGDKDYKPFDSETDYYRYVDGKPRYDGARSFLESRGISLPFGNPDDPPGKETVCGLGNRKNRYFLDFINKHGVDSYRSTVDFIHELKRRHIRVAAISASRNAKAVLKAAGVDGLFQVVVDGIEADKHALKGKPAPDIFLDAAGRLKVEPEHAMVVEDAVSGVEAGRAGGFRPVIGIDRSGRNEEIENGGADIVVRDLSEIMDGINEGK